MPQEAYTVEAATHAAQTMNNNLPVGILPVPEGYVCVGYGGDRLTALKAITGLERFPCAWEDGARHWNINSWAGNARYYLYAVTLDHFMEWAHVYCNPDGTPAEPKPEPEPEPEPNLNLNLLTFSALAECIE